ncbi:MAG: HNH endonuclease [Candidatus Dormibacteraeota bacterium]|nr:HNH endonuclease [Candidatus Dormibacteraeota bacterium]
MLCSACSSERPGAFTPLLGQRTTRERRLQANNHRSGTTKLTRARRRQLIADRGDRCESCGVPGPDRQLDVHHRLAVSRGGDDAEDNLLVLCFVCHHDLQPCPSGCGRWARKSALLCRHCETRSRLEDLFPAATWDDIKTRVPGLGPSWPHGYEPRPNPHRRVAPASPAPEAGILELVAAMDAVRSPDLHRLR